MKNSQYSLILNLYFIKILVDFHRKFPNVQATLILKQVVILSYFLLLHEKLSTVIKFWLVFLPFDFFTFFIFLLKARNIQAVLVRKNCSIIFIFLVHEELATIFIVISYFFHLNFTWFSSKSSQTFKRR